MSLGILFWRYRRWNPVHPTAGALWRIGVGLGCGAGWSPVFGPEAVGSVGAGCGAGFNIGVTLIGVEILSEVLVCYLVHYCARAKGEMEKLKLSVSSMKGNYAGYRKKQLEPLLATLLEDPILSDVPKKKLTLKDLNTLVGVEKGSAMMLTVRKMDGTSFDVPVLNKATVRDLKAAVQKKVHEMEEDQIGYRRISWKHVWGNFCLVHNHENLLNESASLSEFGLKNGDQLEFVHHIASREAGRHSKAKKRRFFHGLRKNVSFEPASPSRKN